MERGQRESRCLKLVQNAMFTQNGEPVRNFITHKNCFEVSDEEFEKNQILYINGNCSKIYFGLIEEDRKEIQKILRSAKPNESASEFPDFLFAEGFIEHFQVTSSKTSRKVLSMRKRKESFIPKLEEKQKY